jgi:hypothetical protein
VYPDKLTPMCNDAGTYVKPADDDDTSKVDAKRSVAHFMKVNRLFLFSHIMGKADPRWFGPLAALQMLDVLQQLASHPNVKLDEAYEERDAMLRNIREKTQGWPDAQNSMSVNAAVMQECKTMHVRLVQHFTKFHARLVAEGQEVPSGGGDKKLRDEVTKLERENSKLREELSMAKNTITNLKTTRNDSRGDSRGRDNVSRKRDKSQSRERVRWEDENKSQRRGGGGGGGGSRNWRERSRSSGRNDGYRR